jgi:hypothetical protein
MDISSRHGRVFTKSLLLSMDFLDMGHADSTVREPSHEILLSSPTGPVLSVCAGIQVVVDVVGPMGPSLQLSVAWSLDLLLISNA